MKKYLLALLCFLVFLTPVFAEQNYSDWIGKEVIFLPKPQSSQKYGYQLYYYDLKGYKTIPYGDLANKSATIINLEEEYGMIQVTLRTEDGKIVYGKGYNGNLNDIGFKSEMENAKQYLGKTVWSKTNLGGSPYTIDPVTNKPKNIRLPNITNYIVENIEWGFYDHQPLKFTLKSPNNEIVYWEGTFSRINDTSNHLMKPFEEYWYLDDPTRLYPKWSQRTWNAIKEYKIYIGMTKEMVLMSWGEPKKINKTILASGVSEQWVYSLDSYVYFDDGVVSAIQN